MLQPASQGFSLIIIKYKLEAHSTRSLVITPDDFFLLEQ